MFSQNIKKQYIYLIIVILCLFAVYKKPIFIDDNLSKKETVQVENVSPKELFLDSYKLVKENYWDKELCENNLSRWKKRYLNKIKDTEDAKIAINSMLQSLDDPYSKFLDEEEFSEQNTHINSKIYGIGVNIASESGKVIIINVVKGTPADFAGLKPLDMILKINNQETNGKSLFQVANYIKDPKYDSVSMEILRGNKKLTKQIKKTEIKIKTVKSDIIDKQIGYIKISSFISSDTPVEFIDAINNALILDLRGNTGGLFQNAVFVADIFLDDKNIVSVLGRNGKRSLYKTHKKNYFYDKPMVVLVDFESASASEIVSGALKDNKRAIIVGTRTFGKGLVQKIFELPNQTGLNLTIARYLTPNETDINKKGISPDYLVQITKEDQETNNDRQLNFAIKTLHNEIERKKLAKNN